MVRLQSGGKLTASNISEEDGHNEPSKHNNQLGMGRIHQGRWRSKERAKSLTTIYKEWKAKLERKSVYTRITYIGIVDDFLKFVKMPPHRIHTVDVQEYLNTLQSRATREKALAAIKSFLKVAGRTVGEVELGPVLESRVIEPITELDFERMLGYVTNKGYHHLRRRNRALLLILRDSGGRASALLSVKAENLKGEFPNMFLVLERDRAKNRRQSTCALTERTQKALLDYIKTDQPQGKLFPIPRNCLWKLVSSTAKKVGIAQPVYPHLFRHMRALNFMDQEAKPDTVLNHMGWTDTKQYFTRYGRRAPQQTMKEARTLLESGPSTSADVAQVIGELANLLAQGKIDLQTYQASLAMIIKKPEKEPEAETQKGVPGYN